MNTNTIDSESTRKLEPEVAKTDGKRTPAKKAKSAKKAARAKRTAGKPAAERSNKKAEVVALMKRSIRQIQEPENLAIHPHENSC
jgi:hypothetical protein